MSIQERLGQIKSEWAILGRSDVYIVLLIILVGLASFGLGRLSKIEQERPPVTITNAFPEVAEVEEGSVLPAATQAQGQFVASRNGTKYHFPWCPGAQQMKEANKIWFATREDAEQAGYTPAANCKGL